LYELVQKYLLEDPDKTGQLAATKAIEELLASLVNSSRVRLQHHRERERYTRMLAHGQREREKHDDGCDCRWRLMTTWVCLTAGTARVLAHR
jgi:hypothetical protein